MFIRIFIIHSQAFSVYKIGMQGIQIPFLVVNNISQSVLFSSILLTPYKSFGVPVFCVPNILVLLLLNFSLLCRVFLHTDSFLRCVSCFVQFLSCSLWIETISTSLEGDTRVRGSLVLGHLLNRVFYVLVIIFLNWLNAF